MDRKEYAPQQRARSAATNKMQRLRYWCVLFIGFGLLYFIYALGTIVVKESVPCTIAKSTAFPNGILVKVRLQEPLYGKGTATIYSVVNGNDYYAKGHVLTCKYSPLRIHKVYSVSNIQWEHRKSAIPTWSAIHAPVDSQAVEIANMVLSSVAILFPTMIYAAFALKTRHDIRYAAATSPSPSTSFDAWDHASVSHAMMEMAHHDDY